MGMHLLDEAQNIKNAQTKQSSGRPELPCETPHCLTGTPIENRLSELWSIYDFMNPGYPGQRPGIPDSVRSSHREGTR